MPLIVWGTTNQVTNGGKKVNLVEQLETDSDMYIHEGQAMYLYLGERKQLAKSNIV